MLQKLLYISIFLLYITHVNAQKQDNIWYFGWGFKPKTDSTNIADSTWGGTNFDFNFDPPKIYYDPIRNLSIEASNASICDENGDMIFYSNGMQIAAADGSFIADTIAYNTFWEQNKIIYESNIYTYGNGLPHTSLILPAPGSIGLY
ncbi:MAG: hypothetical protein ABIV51_04775, partial [Saprospiraceae bacterium]